MNGELSSREDLEAFERAVESAASLLNDRIRTLSKYYEDLRKQKKALASEIEQTRLETLDQSDRVSAAAKNIGERECCSAMENAASKLKQAASMLKGL